ncbi:amidase [Pararhodobacter sp. CCB-MM2]|uniref:amidase n=1 Tax=Pararhodobacter sp. CCB-MM2 TaxID=1786003 RepID=UPI000831633F|nr:amidase [Pararhodobacter sp. CCB-MM2]
MTTSLSPNWLTAREALALIEAGDLTPVALMDACLDRWRARDAEVRAWTHLDPEAALARAEDATPGPLHGLPVGVKDILYTEEMPTSFNSPHFQDHWPNIDAAAVAMLRKAGAVMMGKLDTVEFAVNGRRAATMNPHDLTRTPGGSSSGSAAAVADGQVPVSLGTQTGGSVIRPASYCGVYAIKPTWNLVSHEGFKVCAASFDTLGWYARSAEDLDLLAEVFGIEDVPAPASLQGATIAICRSPVWDKAEPATVAAMAEAEARLRAAGAEIRVLDLPPAFDGLTEAHRIIMQAEMRVSFLAEYRELGEALYPEMVSILKNEKGDSRADLLAALDLAAACRAEFDRLAAPFDAVLTPSTAGEAPVGPENTGAATFNRIWTLLHMPCVNVPGLTGPQGLPVGLTLTGPRYSDRRLIALAGQLGSLLSQAPMRPQ